MRLSGSGALPKSTRAGRRMKQSYSQLPRTYATKSIRFINQRRESETPHCSPVRPPAKLPYALDICGILLHLPPPVLHPCWA